MYRICLKKRIYPRQAVCFVYDANTPKKPDCSYCKYDRFDLDELGNEQCKAEFRFYKNDINFSSLLDIFNYQMRLLLTKA